MRDFLGKEIKVGDKVVWVTPWSKRNKELRHGTVVRFSKKPCIIILPDVPFSRLVWVLSPKRVVVVDG